MLAESMREEGTTHLEGKLRDDKGIERHDFIVKDSFIILGPANKERNIAEKSEIPRFRREVMCRSLEYRLL